MSQIIKNLLAGPVPPAVPTSFVTDVNSPSIPIANVENIFGGETSANNNNGIQTDGSSGSNTITIQLTNRLTGTVTTTDATPTTVLTFPLSATPGVYYISGDILAYNITNNEGAAYSFFSGIRSTGAAAVEIATELKDIFEEATMIPADFTVSTSGNSVLVQVIGILSVPPTTIHWSCMITYRFVS